VHNNDILRVRIFGIWCSGCLSFDLDKKKFSTDKKMMWFGLAGFLLVRRAISTPAQDASFTDLFL
jgi:hypothetical protein